MIIIYFLQFSIRFGNEKKINNMKYTWKWYSKIIAISLPQTAEKIIIFSDKNNNTSVNVVVLCEKIAKNLFLLI